MKKEPIKRHEALIPLSRDHHFGLLLSWKINQGLKFQIPKERIANYLEWFWKSHLKQHFFEEEQFIFPILGENHEMVKRALREHQLLENLIQNKESFAEFTSLINEHIRFEERELFNEIQKIATKDQLENISKIEHQAFVENWEDQFWIKQ